MREQRPVLVTIGACICALSRLAAFTTLAAPIPRSVAYASVMAAVLGLVGAYGVWRLRRWGAALSVVILGINALLGAPGIPFAPNSGMHFFATLTVVFNLLAITLLVLPASRRTYA